MKHLFTLVLFFLVSPSLAFALSCPNKPSNATTLATVHFNTNDGEGQLWDVYPGAGRIQAITGSEGTTSASVLAAGQSTGGQVLVYPKNSASAQPLSNLYVCLRYKMNAEFVGIREGNKLFFMMAGNFAFGRATMGGVFYVNKTSSAYPWQQYQLIFSHNSGALNNEHTCSGGLGLTCYPNVNTALILPDTWVTIEAYLVSSSCTTCRNGILRWWQDGALQGNYTNMNYGDGILNEFQINHTWDGATGKQCGPPTNPSNPQGRDCTNPQIHYFDELLVASVGGLAPPPPPPPPPPPSGPIDSPVGAPVPPIGLNVTKNEYHEYDEYQQLAELIKD